MISQEQTIAEPSVMMLGAEHGSALGVIRGLGRRGIRVYAGGCYARPAAGYSRFVTRRFTYSDSPDLAFDQIVERLRRWRPGVLLPIMDHAWSVVYSHLTDWSDYTTLIPCPDSALRDELGDKARLARLAEAHGVAMPRTFAPPSVEEALALQDELPYPVLLKPAAGTAGIGISLVRDAASLEAALQADDTPPMIQEYVEGEDLELTILADRGEPVAGSAYVTLRNRPPYGPPVACRTIHDDEFMRIGTGFLRGLGYHGVAHLDFRRDRRDGEPKLLDFNVRLAGSNEISTRTGVDFAYLLYQLALGRRVEPCFEYEVGTEFRWPLFGEIRHLVCSPHKGAVASELLRWRGVHTDVSLSDPLPHVVDLFNVLANVGAGLVHRSGTDG